MGAVDAVLSFSGIDHGLEGRAADYSTGTCRIPRRELFAAHVFDDVPAVRVEEGRHLLEIQAEMPQSARALGQYLEAV